MKKNKLFKKSQLFTYAGYILFLVILTTILSTNKNNMIYEMENEYNLILTSYGYVYSEHTYSYPSERLRYINKDFSNDLISEIEIMFKSKESNFHVTHQVTNYEFTFNKYDNTMYEIINILVPHSGIEEYKNEIENVLDNKLYIGEERNYFQVSDSYLRTSGKPDITVRKQEKGISDYEICITINL
jgi:hypothetical protein